MLQVVAVGALRGHFVHEFSALLPVHLNSGWLTTWHDILTMTEVLLPVIVCSEMYFVLKHILQTSLINAQKN